MFCASYWCVFDLPGKESHLVDLEKQINAPDFWNAPAAAQQVSKSAATLRAEVEDWRTSERRVQDALELAGLIRRLPGGRLARRLWSG